MRRIAEALNAFITDTFGFEGMLLALGIIALAAWAQGPQELNALLVFGSFLTIAAIAVAKPKRG